MELAGHGRARDPTEQVASAPPPRDELHATIDGICELVRGRVRCAGRNMWGEVGDGTREPHAEWTNVAGTEGAVQLAAGGQHVCVRLEDRTARCWGQNEFAQLGDGVGGQPRTAPVKVVLEDVEDVAAGLFHTCARTRSGEVSCWGGKIDSVQIAYDKDPSTRLKPTSIVKGASRLVVGHERSYAKTSAGWITWAPARTRSPLTTSLPVLDDATEIALGWADECALTAAGDVRCWGASHASSYPRAHDPERARRIAGLPPVARVTVGRAHACALLRDGHVQCWGELHGYVAKPAVLELVPGITDAIDIAAGFDFTCARLASGAVKCWGRTEFLPAETQMDAARGW